jgi:AcrR family transcriptional regulator
MATARREELAREAARLFAERGFHGTSMDALAQSLGVQKGSLYSLIGSKQELLYAAMRDGADAFHAALDAVPEEVPAIARVRAALRGHLRVVVEQLDVATVFTREWRYLEGDHRAEIVAERRRYEERWRALFREGVESGDLRTDLDSGAATLLVVSAANWAYTWLEPGRDTDQLADRFLAILVDGIRGYATPR